MHRLVAFCTAALLVSSSTEARAEDSGEPWDPRLAPFVAVEGGAGKIDEDTIATARAIAGLSLAVPTLGCSDDEAPCHTLFRVAAQAPLRFVVTDLAPEQDGIIREEDWDQPGDYFRALRTLQFGSPSETLYFRGGELTQRRLGHATIVDGFTNVVGPDRFEFGIESSLNTRYGGVELLLDDVVAPEVAGGRAYVRPWAFREDSSFMRRIAMGLTLMADIASPTALETTNGTFEFADDGRLAVAETETTWVAGFDVEFVSLEGDNYAVTHYFDGNVLADAPGVHLGTLLDLPFDDRLQLEVRAEVRALGRGYIPGYFSPLHEIDRYAYTGWGVDTIEPKRRVAASIDDTTVGGLVGFDLRVAPWVNVGMSYAGHGGPTNDTVAMRLDVGPVGPVRLGAYYFRQNVDGFGDAFELDEALIASEARVAVWGPIYLHGAFMRAYGPDEELGYAVFNSWNAGLGAAYTF